MPHKRNPKVAERICGLARVVRAAAIVGLENVALWHERDISQSSAERVVDPGRVPRARLHARPLHLDRRRPRRLPGAHAARTSTPRTGSSSRTGCCSRSSRPGCRATRPTASCSGTRWRPGTRSATSARSSTPIPRSRRASTPPPSTTSSTSKRPSSTSTPSSSACTPSPEGGARACLKPRRHVASGKVRELYALDDERLLLVASDRISTFDVVLPTEIPDKGRVLTGLSGFWFAQTASIVPNHLLALRRRRPLDRVPPARDAADRVRRPRLPRRLRLEGLPRDRRGLRPPAAGRARRVATGCPSRSSRRRRRRRPATTRTSTAPPRSRSSARSASTRSSG